MATKSVAATRAPQAIRNPVCHGHAVLTPQVFRRIDIIARRLTGRACCVQTPIGMDQLWGRCHFVAEGVYRDVRKLCDRNFKGYMYAEIATIELSNAISVEAFHKACRPEIDLSKIPAERIYEFVAWHEIGHALDNFDHLARAFGATTARALQDERALSDAMGKLNEVLSDRFAWERMFPGQALPVRERCEHIAAWAQDWTGHLTAAGIRRGPDPKWGRQSIDTHPLTYVPQNHVRNGIPWSTLAKREVLYGAPWLTALKKARHDDRNHALRRVRSVAKEGAALLLEFVAKRPTMAAHKAMQRGDLLRYARDQKWRREMLDKVAKEGAT